MLKQDINVKKRKKGQSTVEYIILVAAVIGALIVFLSGDTSPFKKAFNATLTEGINGMQNMAHRLATSRPNK